MQRLLQHTSPVPCGRSLFKLSLQRLFALALLSLFPTASYAEPHSCQHIPAAPGFRGGEDGRPESKEPYRNAYVTYGYHFTAKKFTSLYFSDNPDDRRFAEFFMLGVLQASEGKLLCIKEAKTLTVVEQLYTPLHRLDEARCNEPAASVITSIVHNFAPCKEQ
jgi:hypothetical protein